MKIYIQVLLFSAILLSISSCKKYNQVDNSGTVKIPYILYVGGYFGTLHKTNDALYYSPLFKTDASTVRQVLAADTMLLYMKQNFYFSRNEGKAFQESNNNARDFEDLFFKYFFPNQALCDKIDTTVYLCTKSGLDSSGNRGETFQKVKGWGSGSINPSSITQLENGTLFIIKDSDQIYKKAPYGLWQPVFSNAFNCLPKDTNSWYITHKFNMLFAIDFSGNYGVYFSLDEGVNWAKCSGLPTNRKILFGNQPISTDNSFFVGLDSAGLYRSDGVDFKASGQGIPWYAKVHFVTGKKVVYRTDVERYYHFCATDVGLFISENDGVDWRKIRDGAFSALY